MVRDTADPVEDEHLAKFVVASHMRSHPRAEEADLENMVRTEAALASCSALGAVEKIPQVDRRDMLGRMNFKCLRPKTYESFFFFEFFC